MMLPILAMAPVVYLQRPKYLKDGWYFNLSELLVAVWQLIHSQVCTYIGLYRQQTCVASCHEHACEARIC
jgi:hypothetical protein